MATHSSTLAWKIPWTEVGSVPGIAKSWTRLSDFTFTFYFHALEKEMATPSICYVYDLLISNDSFRSGIALPCSQKA